MGRGNAQPLGRAHNYGSGACSYSGLYQGQALVSPLQPTASALLPSGRVCFVFTDWTCAYQHEVKIIYQLLQDGILLYHPLEDSFGLDQVVGCTHYFAFPYLEDNPVGYVYMGGFLLRRGVLFYEVRHNHFTKGHASSTLFPLGISVRIGKEEDGSSAQHTEFFLFHLALAACRQPYIAGKDGRTDNGTLFGFHQDHHLVGITA